MDWPLNKVPSASASNAGINFIPQRWVRVTAWRVPSDPACNKGEIVACRTAESRLLLGGVVYLRLRILLREIHRKYQPA